MKYWIFGMVLALSACGSKQDKKVELAPKVEKADVTTTETEKTKEESTMESIDTNPLAAPSNVSEAPAEAITTPSGLSFIILREGIGGETPSQRATVTAHYTGWQTDGKMFDSSVERGAPFTAPLSRLIKGWQEGMALMTKGEKRRVWIPAELAYGENPRPGAPSGMLVFDVELIDFEEPK